MLESKQIGETVRQIAPVGGHCHSLMGNTLRVKHTYPTVGPSGIYRRTWCAPCLVVA